MHLKRNRDIFVNKDYLIATSSQGILTCFTFSFSAFSHIYGLLHRAQCSLPKSCFHVWCLLSHTATEKFFFF